MDYEENEIYEENVDYANDGQMVCSHLEEADLDNMSNSEVLDLACMLGKLPPESVEKILDSHPVFMGAVKTSLAECNKALSSIIRSDDESLNAYYNFANKEIDNDAESRRQFFDYVNRVQSDCSKLLDNPEGLQPETIIEIINKESELMKMVDKKDSEIREHEKELEDKVNRKDSEKRKFNWGLVKAIVSVALTVGSAFLGSNIDVEKKGKGKNKRDVITFKGTKIAEIPKKRKK